VCMCACVRVSVCVCVCMFVLGCDIKSPVPIAVSSVRSTYFCGKKERKSNLVTC